MLLLKLNRNDRPAFPLHTANSNPRLLKYALETGLFPITFLFIKLNKLTQTHRCEFFAK